MNDNSGLCCDDCFDILAKRSPSAASLWVTICDIQEKTKSMVMIDTDYSPQLRLLENLGFVVTTDRQDHVVIKILGRMKCYEEVHFCTGVCDGEDN